MRECICHVVTIQMQIVAWMCNVNVERFERRFKRIKNVREREHVNIFLPSYKKTVPMNIVKPLMYYLLEKLLTCKSNFTVFSLSLFVLCSLTHTCIQYTYHIHYWCTHSFSLSNSVCGHRFLSIFHLPININSAMMFNNRMNSNYIRLE